MTELIDTRDNKGRFTPGNHASPGRPRKITERAVRDAKQGNAKAREWLAKYLIGDNRAAIQAIQVNQYQSGDESLYALAQLLESLTATLPDAQRREFVERLLSLTKLIEPTEDAEAYTVDEHGVIEFEHEIRPYIKA